MQSPTAVAIRALVMLVCLIAVPLLAIFGKDLPEVVKGVVEGRVTIHPAAPATASTGSLAGNAVLPDGSDDFGATSVAPPFAPAPHPNAIAERASGAGVVAPAGGAVNPTPDLPASFDRPLGGALPTMPEVRPAGGDLAATAPPPAIIVEAPPTSAPPESPPATLPPGGTEAPASSQFAAAEQRLKDLGASYYLLETWGNNGDQYRFFCKMAVAGHANFNRCFQATDADPLRAMESVIGQVEQWRQDQPATSGQL